MEKNKLIIIVLLVVIAVLLAGILVSMPNYAKADSQLEIIGNDTLNEEDNYHLQYFHSMRDNSTRLKEIIERKNVKLPKSKVLACGTPYKIDLALAKEGVIALHNMKLDDETLDNFFITMPESLNDIQKQCLNNILNDYDMSESSFSYLFEDELLDVEFDEISDILGKIIK